MARTRVERRQPVTTQNPVDVAWLRSITLVTIALKKSAAEELLSCLSEGSEEVARSQLNSIVSLSRAARQALLAEEFGCRADAADEVKRLNGEVAGPLGDELLRQLPPFMTSSALAQPAAAEHLSPLGLRWARRLAREASLTGPLPSGG